MITSIKGTDATMDKVCNVLKGAPENIMLKGIAASTIHQNSLNIGLVLPDASNFFVAVADKEKAAESRDVAKKPIVINR